MHIYTYAYIHIYIIYIYSEPRLIALFLLSCVHGVIMTGKGSLWVMKGFVYQVVNMYVMYVNLQLPHNSKQVIASSRRISTPTTGHRRNRRRSSGGYTLTRSSTLELLKTESGKRVPFMALNQVIRMG